MSRNRHTGKGPMQVYRGTDYLECVLHQSDIRKLKAGQVVHCYSVPHFAQNSEVVACKLEVPTVQGYARLGYRVVATYTLAQCTGNRLRIPKRTPAMQQAQRMLAQARALLARTTPHKGK